MSPTPAQVAPVTTRVDLDVNAGDRFDLLVPILDADDLPVAVLDPAVWSARAQVRRNVFAVEVLHEWTTDGVTPNAVVVAGEAGAVRLTASAAETAAWQADWSDWSCGWDLDVTTPPTPDAPDGAPHRIAQGRFRLHPEYTR